MNNFDTIAYLNSRDIKYRTSGKNIGNGDWVGISECVFCGKDNFHLAVNKSGAVNCWICGKHSIQDFIAKIENCGWRKAKEIQGKFKLDPEFLDSQEEVEYAPVTSYTLPKQFTEVFSQEAKEYIKNRGFDFLNLRKKYGILWSGEYGRAKFRIIFPIVMDGKIVNWVGRSIINDKNIIPYQFELDSNSLVKRRDLLFNLDSVKSDRAILVEGIFDAINIGDGAVAMLSINFSRSQIIALKNKGIKKFVIAFDSDVAARKRARELERYLAFAESVEHLELPNYASDPGELREEDIKYIRRMCL